MLPNQFSARPLWEILDNPKWLKIASKWLWFLTEGIGGCKDVSYPSLEVETTLSTLPFSIPWYAEVPACSESVGSESMILIFRLTTSLCNQHLKVLSLFFFFLRTGTIQLNLLRGSPKRLEGIPGALPSPKIVSVCLTEVNEVEVLE